MVTVALPLGICRAADAPTDDPSAVFQRGVADSKDRKFEEAIKEFDQAIHLRPDFAEAYDARGRAYEGLKQLERAWADYDQAVSLKPDFREAVADRARVQGSARTLPSIFDLSSGQQPTSAEMFVARARSYMGRGDKQLAIADLDQAIKLKPDDAEVFRDRGGIYINLGQYARALEDLDQAIKLDPHNAEALNDRGVCYQRLGDQPKALGAYKEAVKWKPDYALAHNNLGSIYSQMGQNAEAIASYSEAIRLNPRYALALNNRGRAQRALLHFPEAIADSTAALAIDPNFAEAFDNRGKAYNMTNRGELARADFSRARDVYEQRLRSDPRNPGLHLARANSAYDAHRWSDAVADYSSYIALNDAASPLPVAQMAHAYLFRGWARIGVHDYEAALADIETAFRLQPDIKTGRLARAASLRGLGRYQEALKDDDATIDPKEPTTYLTRAITYFCLGLYLEGEEDVQRFIEIGRNVDKDSRWLLHIFRVKRGTTDDGFVDNRAPLPQTDWVTEIDSLYRGRQSIADTQKAMDAGHSGPWKNDPWPCAAKFFLGEYKLEHGDLAGARADLGAITPANCMWPEAAAAVAEMKRLPAN